MLVFMLWERALRRSTIGRMFKFGERWRCKWLLERPLCDFYAFKFRSTSFKFGDGDFNAKT